MKKTLKITISNPWFWVFGLTSILMLVVSLLLPPKGQIDPSVIQAVGELFGFTTLGTVIHGINKGVDARIKHKDTEIAVGDFDKESRKK